MTAKRFYLAPKLVRLGAYAERGFAESTASDYIEDPHQPGSQTEW